MSVSGSSSSHGNTGSSHGNAGAAHAAHAAANAHATHAAHATHTTHAVGKTTAKKGAGPTRSLAAKVRSINISRFHARGKTTFCNQAFQAYAAKFGVKMSGVANQMNKAMAKPGSGWHKTTAAGAIAAAKAGKLVAASWYNNKPMKGRPDGKAPGHIAMVVGEYAKGVPGIAQAGRKTFEWGSINSTRKNPTYFVHD